ncbi:MAG: DNA topoisomerase, partial [Methyloligellaceae bacterium]
SKAKNAQEAHEAIRPTDLSRTPESVQPYLDAEHAKLYALIWRRTMASQMAVAELERTTVDVETQGKDGKLYALRATGTVVRFDGFLKIYEEGKDDAADADGGRLPPLAEGQSVTQRSLEAKQHFTEPPPRYSEATLIKKMEELGIGRPSTYTSTLNVLRDREYVRMEQRRLFPEDKGRLVTAFLESFFERYVQYDFTADLEDKLDLISAGKLEWRDVLREFWRDFMAAVGETKDLRISHVLDALNEILGPHVFPETEDGADPRKCPSCEDGKLGLKIGKFGAFIGCTNYPDCRYTRQFADGANGKGETAKTEDTVLGTDPETGLPILLRSGRFGPYLQLGEAVEGEKPKRASIPKGYEPAEVDLPLALRFLALPREIGAHPESGKPIVAGFGRYGPFIEHDGKYANLETPQDVFTVGLNRAVSLLAEKAASGRGRGATVLKELGEHPDGGGKMQVLDGRYGPYVKHGKINATLPKGTDPQEVTIEQAVELVAAKAAKGSKKPKSKRQSKKKKPSTKEAEATG